MVLDPLTQKLFLNSINTNLSQESATLIPKTATRDITLPSITQIFPELDTTSLSTPEIKPSLKIQISSTSSCSVEPEKMYYTNTIGNNHNRYTPYYRSEQVLKKMDAFLKQTQYLNESFDEIYHQHRSRILPEQIKILEMVFEVTEFPIRSIRAHLAKVLGLPMRTVQIWFQNRRQKVRSKIRSSLF